jgi:hypothetical protein
VSFGYGSLSSPLVGGIENVALGRNALNKNISVGSYNTATGSSALYSNNSGYYNTATGYGALYSNTSGFYNTAIGSNALYRASGSYNTALGYRALFTNTTGYNNTAIGYCADVSPGYIYNATAIGSGALVSGSNEVRIGNSNVIRIGGAVVWSTFSDGRIKKNIKADVPGLNFINRLNPVTYNLDLDIMDELLKPNQAEKMVRDSLKQMKSQEQIENEKKAKEAKEKKIQTGFVAQEVEQTAKSINYDFSGVDVDETGVYSLRYAEFVVPLVKAVQELSDQNEQLQKQIDELTGSNKNAFLRSAASEANLTGISTLAQQCTLSQNTPNPFTDQTEIKYFVANGVEDAFICIFDMQGKMIQKLDVQAGQNSIFIEGYQLQAGMYLYSLVADGQEVDTKRMILTK